MQFDGTAHTEDLQERLFGSRYRGATLAKVSIPEADSRLAEQYLKTPKNFLVVTGRAGTGKTYICAAMLSVLAQRFRFIRAYNERTLLKTLRNAISDNSHGDYIEHLHSLIDDDFIIIDDIGSSGHTDWREEVLFEAVDFRYQERKPMIITSNLSKKDFYEAYSERVGSRIFATENTIISLDGMPDYRAQGL